jgi:hypothetical protein
MELCAKGCRARLGAASNCLLAQGCRSDLVARLCPFRLSPGPEWILIFVMRRRIVHSGMAGREMQGICHSDTYHDQGGDGNFLIERTSS